MLIAGQQPQKLPSFPPSQPTRFQSHQSGCCEQVLCGVIGAGLGLGCPLFRPASAHSWLAQRRAKSSREAALYVRAEMKILLSEA